MTSVTKIYPLEKWLSKDLKWHDTADFVQWYNGVGGTPVLFMIAFVLTVL